MNLNMSTGTKVWIVALLASGFVLSFIKLTDRSRTRPEAEPAVIADARSTPEDAERAGKVFNRLPLLFEANAGQAESEAKFVARGDGFGLMFKPDSVAMVVKERAKSAPSEAGAQAEASSQVAVVHMKMAGANPGPRLTPRGKQPTRLNYMIGSDASNWHADIPTYSELIYEQVYAGIDVRYYGNRRQLEYDFIVSPGADPDRVRLDFEGCQSVSIASNGDLILDTKAGDLRHGKPFVYQEVDGTRREVAGSYRITGPDQVGFQLGEYDRTLPLVIDPVLEYSTYLGGNSNDFSKDLTIDSAGNAYIVGDSISPNFLANSSALNSDVFVARFTTTGNMLNLTFFGGNANDFATSVAVDATGNVYMGGTTFSANFPRVNAIDMTLGGTNDAFITKLNGLGPGLFFSTFVGGSGDEAGVSLAIDSATNIYLTGRTNSSADFPRVGAIQQNYGGGVSDAFVSKINANGAAFAYSTFLGGSSTENILSDSGIAVDTAGNAYVTGDTVSTNFPRVNALQQVKAGNASQADAFVSKLNASGAAFVYSTYIGGTLTDRGLDIAADAAGNAYVTGLSESITFFGASPIRTPVGLIDAFVAKLNPGGSAYLYFTFLGGSEPDSGNAIFVDSANNAYVSGSAGAGFVLVNALQPTFAGGDDAFVTRLNSNGVVTFSTYLGGSNAETATGVAADTTGSIYLSGFTSSTNFPTALPLVALHGGAADVFMSKIDPDAVASLDPVILSVTRDGKRLVVLGLNFDIGARLFMDNIRQKKVVNGTPDPTMVLIARKSGKKIEVNQTVLLQVINNDGRVSNVFPFTRLP